MTSTEPITEIAFAIPADLDVAAASEAHARLLRALDEAEASGAAASVDLDDGADAPAPLALQLLVSLTRSLPPARLRLGARAAAALATLQPTKETSRWPRPSSASTTPRASAT
jgi:hypothetical protein